MTSATDRWRAFVLDDAFPCVGARSAVNAGRAHMASYGSLGGNEPVQLQALCNALGRFSAAHPDPGLAPVTCVALFDDDVIDEPDFERRFWCHLQALHRCDARDFAWALGVSQNPGAADFSFSIAGRAFFLVGLHPHASRLARRAPLPSIAFNFHGQFQQLRACGKYDKLQQVIRSRDVALQGSVNPMLSRFGEASEARQYAGRAVAADWACPFAPGGPHGR